MSLRDNSWDIHPAQADLPYGAYYPRVPVTGLTVVCDLPVEWTAVKVPTPPVTPGGTDGMVRAPRLRPPGVKRRAKTCVEIPPAYARARVRGRAHAGSTVEVGAIQVGHAIRIVDPLPGILAEDDEALVLVMAAME